MMSKKRKRSPVFQGKISEGPPHFFLNRGPAESKSGHGCAAIGMRAIFNGNAFLFLTLNFIFAELLYVMQLFFSFKNRIMQVNLT